jgi:predicted PurR-regulated permease PerM
VGEFLSEIVSAFSNFIMVLLLIVFVVIDATMLRQRYDRGEIPSGSSLIQLTELVNAIRKYLSIAASTGFFTAAGNLVLLLILGVDYPVLWAFLSFLFSFIPNIGFVLSVIGPALLALMEIGPVSAIIVVVGFILINELIENVVKPRMMGKELDLSLSMVFLSLIVWAFILGPMGTILAIPLTLVGKMACDVYVKG